MKKHVLMFMAVVACAIAAASAGSASAAGGTITLKSYDQHLRITVLSWIPRVAVDEFDQPKLGDKIVGVKLRIANLANVAYDDSLDNGAVISDRLHRSFDSTIIVSGPQPSIDDARILPHDYAVGWVFFEIPATASPRLLSITLDSGYADEGSATGVWHF